MWTYPELKFVTVNQYRFDVNALANEVNARFHEGQIVRSAREIERIKNSRTIFNKDFSR